MLINHLQNTSCPITQAAMVRTARARVRQVTGRMNCASDLNTYASQVFKVSKEHSAANPLQREAELATQKAVAIQNQPENIAASVIFKGMSYFKIHGKRVSPRIYGMYNRYGNWTDVHVRLVKKNIGGSNFLWLRTNDKIELTSEWFVARYARHLVSAETLSELDDLLSPQNTHLTQAA